jgi:hypothetical protein
MSSSKYMIRLSPRDLPSAKITKVEIIDETQNHVWLPDGKRFRKRSGYENFFNDRKEAYRALLRVALTKSESARWESERAFKCVGKVIELENS